MKVVSYADQGIIDFYDVLLSSWSFQEYNMEALSITNQYKGHYKNRLYLDGGWEYFNASQVGPLSGQLFTLLKSMNLLTNVFYEKWSTLKWEACLLHEKLIHCKPSWKNESFFFHKAWKHKIPLHDRFYFFVFIFFHFLFGCVLCWQRSQNMPGWNMTVQGSVIIWRLMPYSVHETKDEYNFLNSI